MKPIKFYLALYISKGISRIINTIAPGRGTNLPGGVALRIDSRFVEHIASIDPDKMVFVTGTNGKSTTVNVLVHTLRTAGYKVIANLNGANLISGISTALLKTCSPTGKINTDYIVFETDERYLGMIRDQFPAANLCITNIQKDQAQRNGEPSFIRDKVMEAAIKFENVFANKDDPNSLYIATKVDNPILYSVASNTESYDKNDDFFAVTMPCPVCHDSIKFSYHNIDNVGEFECENCGFGREEQADFVLGVKDYENGVIEADGEIMQVRFNAPAFLYCYSLVYVVCQKLGLEKNVIKEGLESFSDIKGRVAIHETNGVKINYMKMKQENSETLQSTTDYISKLPGPKRLFIGFDEYLDFEPAYTFIFNLYDCDFRKIAKNDIRRWTCTSKALANTAAVKFAYDGLSPRIFRPALNSTEKIVAQLLTQDKSDGIDAPVYMVEEVPFWKKRGVD